jgi:small conductance mechanosensitive channel
MTVSRRLKPRINRLIWLGLCSLSLVLSIVITPGINRPVIAQKPGIIAGSVLAQNSPKVGLSAASVQRQGDIEYTQVVFRGQALFPVTAQIDVTTPDLPAATSAATLRALAVESNLATLLRQGLNPETLTVGADTLRNQTIIVASDPPRFDQQVVVTVTSLDVRLAEARDELALAEDWAKTIRAALIQAWEESQPEARRVQRRQAWQIGITILLVSVLMLGWHKLLRIRFRELQKRQQALTAQKLSAAQAKIAPLPSEASETEAPETLKTRFSLRHRLDLNRSARGFLSLGQIALWFWGISTILELFPETRFWSAFIRSFPVQILVISSVLFFAARLSQTIIHRYLQRFVEEAQMDNHDDSREMLRVPTLETVLYGITNAIAWGIGLIWFLVWRQVDLAAALTGAGIFGAALGLIFQSLIKDWLNGILIIFEDQYAVGDVVDINGTVGFVEKMSIRSSQVRTAGGCLSTIPHNQVGTVHNLTKDWSRVDFTIEISNQANPADAMAIMKQVATDMQRDPAWQGDILEPTSLIGVSSVNSAGTQIMMWIKTRRMRQWDVEREFRRRLKLAFEERGIAIAVPQQTLYVQSEPDISCSGSRLR